MTAPGVAHVDDRTDRAARPVTGWPTLGAELLAGTLLTGAGVGLAARHLAKTGWSATTAVGVLLVAAGGLLLGTGLRGWWRRTRWWRLALVPGGVLGLLVGASTAVAVMATVVPPTTLGPGTPASAGLPYEDVSVTTADGVTLSGWYVPSRNSAAVVVLHGAGSTRTAVLPQAAALADAGYGVLLLDARGHGESGGRGMDLGWYGERDVTAAVDHLAARPDVDAGRIGVLGESMGGEEAIGAAAADPRIRAVVAEGATGRTAADKDAWLPGGVPGAVQRALDRFTYFLVDLLTPAPHPPPLAESVQAATGARFLLVTAGDDPDEEAAAAVLERAAPDRVQTWDVAGAGHTAGLRTAPDDWQRRVIGFLDAALLAPPD